MFLKTLAALFILQSLAQVAIAESNQQRTSERLAPRVVTLEQAIHLALESSFKLKAAQADSAASRAKQRSAYSQFGPKIYGEYSDATFDEAVVQRVGAGAMQVRGEQVKTGAIVAVQPVTGIISAAQKASLQSTQTDLKKLEHEILETEIAFNTAIAYRRAQHAREMISVAKARVETADSQRRDAHHLAESGRLSDGQLASIEIAYHEAQAELVQSESTFSLALSQLSSQMGNITEDIELEKLHDPEAATLELSTATRAQEESLEKRVELKRAQLARDAASTKRKLVYSKFTPQINAFAKWEKSFEGKAAYFPEKTQSYGFQLNWELWDNGSRFFETQEAVSEEKRLDFLIQDLRIQVQFEVTEASARLNSALDAFNFAKANMKHAEEAYRATAARFAAGSATATELLFAEESRAKFKSRLLFSKTEVDIQRFRLEKALGEKRPRALLNN